MKEPEENYIRVTDEAKRALQVALTATTMVPDEYSDNYTVMVKYLRSRLTAVQEPVTERHLKTIIVQGLPENCRHTS